MGELFVPLLLLWLCVSFWLIELCAVKTTDATIWEIFSWKYSVLCFTKRQRHVCINMSRNTYSEKHSCWIETDGSAFRSPLIDVVVVVVWFSGSVLVVLLWNPDWHRWMCYSPLIVVVHVSCWQLPSFSFASSSATSWACYTKQNLLQIGAFPSLFQIGATTKVSTFPFLSTTDFALFRESWLFCFMFMDGAEEWDIREKGSWHFLALLLLTRL